MAAMKFTQSHAVVNTKCASVLLLVAVWFWLFSGGDASLFAQPAMPSTFPACLPSGQRANVVVAKSSFDGILTLNSGQSVKLGGLLMPRREEGAPQWLLSRAAALLKDLLHQSVVLRFGNPKMDRYGRLRAQAILADGRWLQREVLSQGLARVFLAPDRRECAGILNAAEDKARVAGVGLWALPAYRVRAPDSLGWRDLGSFQIIEGKVRTAKVSGGRAYLNFGDDWRTDFTVTVSPEDMKNFRQAAVDPYSYNGKSLRVRGYIEHMHGFEIEAASPEAIEVLKK